MNTSDPYEFKKHFTSLDDTACEVKAIALGQQGQAALPIMTDLLQADEPDVRFWVVRALWANSSPQAIMLLKNALNDQEEMIRSGAALALGELKAEAAVEALASLMTNDPGLAGNHAADALCKIGQASAPVLIEALKHQEAWARVRAAKALIPIESHEAIGPLFYALEDESYMVNHYAQEALARMGVGEMVYFKV